MAYANAHSQHRLNGWLILAADFGAAVSAAWARSRVFARTYAELNALSDREMRDLGIHRSMIRGMAHEAAYGRDD